MHFVQGGFKDKSFRLHVMPYHVCICTKSGPFGFQGVDGKTHWRCLKHRGFEVSEKLVLEAYQKNACEKSLPRFAKLAKQLNILDKPIRSMAKADVLRLIAAATNSYEHALGDLFDQSGAFGESPPLDLIPRMAQACPQCGNRGWVLAKKSKNNKKLVGVGCKKCSHVVWINKGEENLYGIDT